MSENKIPVIIDTDPGVDDSIAIALAASCGRFDILGLTPVDGNVKYPLTQKNALDLAEYLNLGCPVAKGAEHQLERQCPRSSKAHGNSGLGCVSLPAANGGFHPLKAWDFIYQKAFELKGELSIIAIGPLTNIAILFREHPDVKPLIKRIVIMGGSTGRGNVTPYAEFNFWVDPAAAREVFESGVELAMAGLNVTMKTGISLRFIKEITACGGDFAQKMSGFVQSYGDQFKNKEGEASSIVHDAIPVMYLAHPEYCTAERCRITIVDDGEQYGRSVADYSCPDRFNCTVITDVDLREYERLYQNMMDYFKDIKESV